VTFRPIDQEEIDRRLDYHPPTPEQVPIYEAMRPEFKRLVEFVVETTPPGREQSVAITFIEDAQMWANKAIACAKASDGD
jgi:hypothetical protein